jgi:hypothetical protein
MKKNRLAMAVIVLSILTISFFLMLHFGDNSQKARLELEDLQFIEIGIGYNELTEKLGQPDRDRASGVFAPEYDLADGGIITLTFSSSGKLYGVSITTPDGITMDYFEYMEILRKE